MITILFIVFVVVALMAAFLIAMRETVVLSDAQYDRLGYFANTFIPVFVTLIAAIDAVLKIPYGAAVISIVAAVGVFIKALLDKAKDTWNKTSDEDLQLNRELDPGYIGERFFTDEEGNLLEEVETDEKQQDL